MRRGNKTYKDGYLKYKSKYLLLSMLGRGGRLNPNAPSFEFRPARPCLSQITLDQNLKYGNTSYSIGRVLSFYVHAARQVVEQIRDRLMANLPTVGASGTDRRIVLVDFANLIRDVNFVSALIKLTEMQDYKNMSVGGVVPQYHFVNYFPRVISLLETASNYDQFYFVFVMQDSNTRIDFINRNVCLIGAGCKFQSDSSSTNCHVVFKKNEIDDHVIIQLYILLGKLKRDVCILSNDFFSWARSSLFNREVSDLYGDCLRSLKYATVIFDSKVQRIMMIDDEPEMIRLEEPEEFQATMDYVKSLRKN